MTAAFVRGPVISFPVESTRPDTEERVGGLRSLLRNLQSRGWVGASIIDVAIFSSTSETRLSEVDLQAIGAGAHASGPLELWTRRKHIRNLLFISAKVPYGLLAGLRPCLT